MTTKHTLKSLLSERATAMAMLNDALGRGEVDEGYGLLSSVSDICEIHSARTFLAEKKYKAEIAVLIEGADTLAEIVAQNDEFHLEKNAKLKAEIAVLIEGADTLAEIVARNLAEIAELKAEIVKLKE